MINQALYALGINGGWKIKNGQIAKWYSEQPQPTESEIQAKIAELTAVEPLRQLRIKRNQLLQETDWRATVDYPNPDKQAWLDYRQALRDLPATADPQLDENGQLTNIVWPEEPQ
jgi:hypothetical protein